MSVPKMGSEPTIRVGLIGAGHWHAAFYHEPILELDSAHLCGVSDPSPEAARRVAQIHGCPWFADHDELLRSTRPDFVFALGPHAEMAAIAKTLVASKVPFALEKPCGVSLSEVASLRDAAERACVHASVPFAFRCSEFFKQVMRRGAPGACSQMTFKFIVGSPRRYLDANCDWMLDPKIAGGGCTVNLAVHFFDLFKVFSGVVPTVAGAVMSNATHGLQIEDYSAVLLTGGRASGVVETGYTFPAAMGAFDLRFSLRSEGYYLTATGADAAAGDRLVVRGTTGEWEVIEAPASQVPYYAAFVRETLRRWRKGDPPIADLSDMCDAMEVLEAAYRAAGWTVKK